MRAAELMRSEVVTIRETDPIEEVLDVLIGEHIHGAPVVNDEESLVGVISQLDIYFGKMSRDGGANRRSSLPGADPGRQLVARDVMTTPAVSATEETDVVDLCRMMYKLRIHRVPIVRGAKVAGIVSSLDVCNALALGKLVVAE